MTWVRLDDQFPSHPKIARAGGDAAWLYVCGLCYCAAHLTDGIIPKAVVPQLSDRRKPAALARRLAEVGLWIDAGDSWEVHDYLAFQPSRQKVTAEREAAAERMRNRRRSSGEHAGSPIGDNTRRVRDNRVTAVPRAGAPRDHSHGTTASVYGHNDSTTLQVEGGSGSKRSGERSGEHAAKFESSSHSPSPSPSSYISSSPTVPMGGGGDGGVLEQACHVLAGREADRRDDIANRPAWVAARARNLARQHADAAARVLSERPDTTPAQLVAYLDGSRPVEVDRKAVAAAEGANAARVIGADPDDWRDKYPDPDHWQAFLDAFHAAERTSA